MKSFVLNGVLVLLFSTILASCGSYQSATQVEEGATLQLSGNYHGTELVVDNGQAIAIDKNTRSFKLNGEKVVRFSLNRGGHTIKIYRAGTLIVDRKIYVSEGNVVEMQVP